MKKFFLTTVVLTVAVSAFKADAYPMSPTHTGTIPSNVIMDSRPIPNMAQRALRESADGIRAVLSAAEAQGNWSTSGYADSPIVYLKDGSFPGVTGASLLGTSIEFTFDLNEVGLSSSRGWTLKYTPVIDGGVISNWDCTSTLSRTDLGPTFVRHAGTAAGGIDPLLSGLGWPFSGCTVAAA